LKAIPADGGAAKTLVPLPEPSGRHFYEFAGPAWSPDSKHLAYVEGDITNVTADYPSSLVLIDPDGAARRVVTKVGSVLVVGSQLAWSPDGTKIAFQDHRGDRIGIWTVSVGGGEPKLLIDDYHYSSPSWGPAGT
jgi:Tol biopolymer transport system component